MISRRPSPRATTPALIRRESTRHLVAESSCFGKVNITRLKSFVGVSGAQRWANGMVCFSLAASHFPVCTPVGSMTTGVTRFLCNSEAFSNPGDALLASPPSGSKITNTHVKTKNGNSNKRERGESLIAYQGSKKKRMWRRCVSQSCLLQLANPISTND